MQVGTTVPIDAQSSSLDDQAVLLNFESDRLPNPQIDQAHNVKFSGPWPVPADGMKAWESGGVVIFAWDLSSPVPQAGWSQRRRRHTSRRQQLEPPVRLPIGATTVGLWARWVPSPSDGMDPPISEVLSFSGGHTLNLHPSGLGVDCSSSAHKSSARSVPGRRVPIPRDVWMAIFLVTTDVSAGICHVYGSWDDTGAHLLGELDALPLGAELRCLGGGPVVGFLTQLTLWSRVVTMDEQAQWFLSKAARYGITYAKELKPPDHKGTHDFFQIFQTVLEGAKLWRERAHVTSSTRMQKTFCSAHDQDRTSKLANARHKVHSLNDAVLMGSYVHGPNPPTFHDDGSSLEVSRQLSGVGRIITDSMHERGLATQVATSHAEGTAAAGQLRPSHHTRDAATFHQVDQQLSIGSRSITDGVHKTSSATDEVKSYANGAGASLQPRPDQHADSNVVAQFHQAGQQPSSVSRHLTNSMQERMPATDVDTSRVNGTKVSLWHTPEQRNRSNSTLFKQVGQQLSSASRNITDAMCENRFPIQDDTSYADGTTASLQPRPDQHSSKNVARLHQPGQKPSSISMNLTNGMQEKMPATDVDTSCLNGTKASLRHRPEQRNGSNSTLLQQVGQQLSSGSSSMRRKGSATDEGVSCADGAVASLQPRPDQHSGSNVAHVQQDGRQPSSVSRSRTNGMQEKMPSTDIDTNRAWGTQAPPGHGPDQHTSRNVALFQQVGQQLASVSTLLTHVNGKKPSTDNNASMPDANAEMGSTLSQSLADEHAALVEGMGSTLIRLRADEHAALVQQATRLLVCESSSESDSSDEEADLCEGSAAAGSNDADGDCQAHEKEQHTEMPSHEKHDLPEGCSTIGQVASVDATKLTGIQSMCRELADEASPSGRTLRLPKVVRRNRQPDLQGSWSRGQLVKILAWSCANTIMRQDAEWGGTGTLGVSCESGPQMPLFGKAAQPMAPLQQSTMQQPSLQSDILRMTDRRELSSRRNGATRLASKPRRPLIHRIRSACVAADRNRMQLKAQRDYLNELGAAMKALNT